MKKVISLMLSLVMMMSITAGLNLTAYAEVLSGNCGENGDNVTYTLDTNTGVLTISGTGKMDCFDYYFTGPQAPWYNNRSSVKTVIIGNGITSIGNSAFYGCHATSITIPDSIEKIGRDAFIGTEYYTNDSYWDNDVLYINNCLIKANNDISGSYEIKSGTRLIAENAFYNCKDLTNITIPNSLTKISYAAFEDCENLSNVTMPNSITSIECYAFSRCSSLTSIKIPDSVTFIDSEALESCDNLTNITVDSNNSVYDSRENCNGIIETATNTLVLGCKITVIPYGIKNIGDNAFKYCNSLTSIIIIPDSVTSIGGYAFRSCDSLTSITIPNSVTSIGYQAFSCCDNLTDVYYSGSQEEWQSISIDMFNEELTNATIHYNSAPAPTPTPTPTTQPTTQPAAPVTTQPATTTAVKKPKATSIKKLSKGKKSFKVTWKKVSGVSGYQVKYSTSKKYTKKTTKTTTIKGAKKTSKTVKKLKSKKKYYVKVRTYKTVKVNGKSKTVYSKWSKTKTVKTK